MVASIASGGVPNAAITCMRCEAGGWNRNTATTQAVRKSRIGTPWFAMCARFVNRRSGKLQPSKRAISECNVAMAAAAARLTAAMVPTMLEVRSTSSNAPSRSAIPAPRAIGNPSPRPRAAASSACHASRGVRPTRREPNAAAITTTLTTRPAPGRPASSPAGRAMSGTMPR